MSKPLLLLFNLKYLIEMLQQWSSRALVFLVGLPRVLRRQCRSADWFFLFPSGMGSHGIVWDWTRMDQNGPEWTRMDQNGPEWIHLG